MHIYGCDFSEVAIDLFKVIRASTAFNRRNTDQLTNAHLQKQPLYDPSKVTAFVCDATAALWPTPFPRNSIDVVLLIFTLSAIQPNK